MITRKPIIYLLQIVATQGSVQKWRSFVSSSEQNKNFQSYPIKERKIFCSKNGCEFAVFRCRYNPLIVGTGFININQG